MASIVQRNKSFSVVYTIYDGSKKKQKWETYDYFFNRCLSLIALALQYLK